LSEENRTSFVGGKKTGHTKEEERIWLAKGMYPSERKGFQRREIVTSRRVGRPRTPLCWRVLAPKRKGEKIGKRKRVETFLLKGKERPIGATETLSI